MKLLLAAATLAIVAAAAPATATDWTIAAPIPDECVPDTTGMWAGGSTTTVSCSTPQCGCNCPAVGAGLEWEAAGQSGAGGAATNGCQTAYAAEVSTGFFDPMAAIVVDPYTWCYPGGLGDSCELTIAATDFP